MEANEKDDILAEKAIIDITSIELPISKKNQKNFPTVHSLKVGIFSGRTLKNKNYIQYERASLKKVQHNPSTGKIK